MLTGLTLTLAAALTLSAPAQPPAPDDERMDWWREARFGMFIHWGLYAVPAGEWNGRTNHAEWIRTTAQIPLEEYDQFLTQFNPVKFDADAWARMAKDAGMKYIVITSKHHDGFCLFDSKHTDFDVMSTPFKRDIMKELSEACARHGLRMCWYHSIMDWHHPDYLPRRDWETTRTAAGADFDRFRQYLHRQVTELLTNYGDIGVMWFDGEWEGTWTREYGNELYDLCRRVAPSVIVNNRVSKGRAGMAGMTVGEGFAGDFGTPEQEVPATGLPGVDWESCITMNGNWGYNKADKNFKSGGELIRMMVDIASKGGNLLLNIGPTAAGEFPPESVERLACIGRWMKVNGESIYGTTASPFAALPWGRCTVREAKGDVGGESTIYLHVFEWPRDGALVLPGLGSEPTGARLLASASETVGVARREGDAVLTLPARAPDADDSVVALTIAGKPVVYLPPRIDAPASIFVDAMEVTLVGSAANGEVRYTLDGAAPTAQSPLASGSVRIADTSTLKARLFVNGRPVSGVSERRFERVTPAPALPTPPKNVGLLCREYLGEWSRLPDFSALTPASERSVTTLELPARPEHQNRARRFEGALLVPAGGLCEFALTSDDGSRLLIGGKTIVDNDGLHASEEKRGVAALAPGWHAIVVEWFNRTGDQSLELKMGPAGGELAPLGGKAFGH